jgi:glycosyltransferase involved in cell wall biosynthesis
LHEKTTVLHIDTEKYWRGGQQQTVYLHQELLRVGWHSILICPPDSKTEQYCADRHIPVITVKMRNEADIISALKISGIVKKEGVNLIIAHSSQALGLAIPAVKKNKNCKLVAIRRVDFHVGKNALSRWKYSTKLLTKIIAVSGAIKNILISDGISPHKITVIHDCIDLNKFAGSPSSGELREKLQIPENNFIIGTVAALAGHKDYPNLLKAAKSVLSKKRDITFIAVGAGHDELSLKKLHKELNLGDNFKFIGFQEDVGRFLKLFDIFVLSSKTEGLGSSLLDAMAMGLPVIGTDAGGIPEIVKHKKKRVNSRKAKSWCACFGYINYDR